MKGKATKTNSGWHVEFSEEFLAELKELPQKDQDAVMEIMKGFEDGSIDPMVLGKRMCGYCGVEMSNETPIGVNGCPECLDNLK